MTRFLILTALCLSLMPPSPAKAEVLVLSDGSVLETKGPWEVDGRRVVYTNTSGVRSMIRLDNVDIEASLIRTEPTGLIKTPAPVSNANYEVDVVALAKRQDTTSLGSVLYKESGMVELGRLAEEVGISFPETGPDMQSIKRARELVKRYLHRVLAATASYDLNTRNAHNASTDIDKIALDAGRLADLESNQYLKNKVHEIASALSGLARMAHQNPDRFIGTMAPFIEAR